MRNLEGEEEATTDDTEPTHDAGELREMLDEREDEIEDLRDEVAERDERIDELESRIKRVRADFENYKKRADDKLERAEERAREEVIDSFLGVRNDLERALDADGDADDLREGVEMVLDTFDETLRSEDAERVPTDEFDPEIHEALARVDSDEHDEGEIVDVYEPGFTMNGRVVRAAKVTVASGDDDITDGT